MRIMLQIGLAAAAAAIAVQALAAPPDPSLTAAGFSDADAVAPDSLDDYRGGFTDPSGLAVSLGIDRIVTVNGNRQAQVAEPSGRNMYRQLRRRRSARSTASRSPVAAAYCRNALPVIELC